MRWLRQKWKRWKIGRTWQIRAEELYQIGKSKPSSWDCDIRCRQLIKEMRSQGLEAGIHFVVDWGTVGESNHMRLNVCGLTVEPSAPNNSTRGFKRKYLGVYDENALWKT